MPAEYLPKTTPTSAHTFYLDTSVVLLLTFAEGVKHGHPQLSHDDRAKVAIVEAFLARAAKATSRVVTTCLAIEELAAKVRNVARAQGASEAGTTWERLKRPTDKRSAGINKKLADRIDLQAQANMLSAMKWAGAVMTQHGIVVDTPAVEANKSQAFSEALCIDHEKLLAQYVGLDAMDALHVAVGMRMRASAFVTLDVGWRSVNEIAVCHP